MDPKSLFEQQVTKFLDIFTHKDWITRRDSPKNTLSLIPNEWILHKLYRGVFLEFSLNVKGVMVFAVGVENPISHEGRSEFKNRLYNTIQRNTGLTDLFKKYTIKLENRGKFAKRDIPLLNNTNMLMKEAIEEISGLIPYVHSLIIEFKNEAMILSDGELTIGRHSKENISIPADDSKDIEYDEGETPDFIDYNSARKIFTQKSEYSVEYLHKLYKRGRLSLQPDFQRQFVWDSTKASSLIESLLLDVPIPIIYLSEDNDGIYSVIDGQQRLCSIFAFIDGNFPDGKLFLLNKLKVIRDLNGKCYRDIESNYQEKLDSSSLSTVIIKKESDQELKFDIYERLNTGSVKLNDQELRNCLYRGNYLNLLKKLAADGEFRYIMGLKGPDKRMKDVEYVLRFGAFYHQTYLKYPHSMTNFLNQEINLYQNIDKEQENDFVSKFKKAVQINYSLFGNRSFRKILCGNSDNPNFTWKSSKVVNAALYDMMMVSFLNYDKNMIYRNLDSIREAYISILTENTQFIDAVEKWTNSPKQVKTRFEIFNKILNDIFSQDKVQERCFSRDFKESLYQKNDKCAICSQQIISVDDAAVDHYEQYWLGGKTIPSNARLTHRYCNLSREKGEIMT